MKIKVVYLQYEKVFVTEQLSNCINTYLYSSLDTKQSEIKANFDYQKTNRTSFHLYHA